MQIGLRTEELDALGAECAVLARGEASTATLEPMEPDLWIRLSREPNAARIDARVRKMRETEWQQEYRFATTRDEVERAAEACARVVAAYPTRGT